MMSLPSTSLIIYGKKSEIKLEDYSRDDYDKIKSEELPLTRLKLIVGGMFNGMSKEDLNEFCEDENGKAHVQEICGKLKEAAKHVQCTADGIEIELQGCKYKLLDGEKGLLIIKCDESGIYSDNDGTCLAGHKLEELLMFFMGSRFSYTAFLELAGEFEVVDIDMPNLRPVHSNLDKIEVPSCLDSKNKLHEEIQESMRIFLDQNIDFNFIKTNRRIDGGINFNDVVLYPVISGLEKAELFIQNRKEDQTLALVPYVETNRGVCLEDHAVLLAVRSAKSVIVDPKFGRDLRMKPDKVVALKWQGWFDGKSSGLFVCHMISSIVTASMNGNFSLAKSEDQFESGLSDFFTCEPEDEPTAEGIRASMLGI